MTVLGVPGIALGAVLDIKVPSHGRREMPKALAGAVVARFEEEDRVPCLGEVSGHHATTRAAANHDVIVNGAINWGSCMCFRQRAVNQEHQGEECAHGTTLPWLPEKLHC